MRLQGLDGGTEACPGSVGECPPEESHCHTDAHIRTQEESSMWKIREIEKPVEDTCQEAKRKMLPNSSYQMCSDGFDEESQRGYWRPKSEIPGTQEDDFLRQNPAGVAHVNHCSVSLVHFSLKASGVVSLHCVSAERHSFPFP